MRPLDEDLKEIKERHEYNLKNGIVESTCIIYDDMISNFRQKEYQSILENAFISVAHSICGVQFVMSQNITSVSPAIRNNCNYVIGFKTHSARELQHLYEMCSTFYNRKAFYQALQKGAWKQPFDFVFIDKKNNKMYHNFKVELLEKDYLKKEPNDGLPSLETLEKKLERLEEQLYELRRKKQREREKRERENNNNNVNNK